MICEVVAVDVSKHIVYDKKCVLCGCVKMRKISLWEFVFNKKKMTGLLMVSLTFCCIMYFIYEHRSVVAFYPVHVKGLIFLTFPQIQVNEWSTQTGATVYVYMFKDLTNTAF